MVHMDADIDPHGRYPQKLIVLTVFGKGVDTS